jgi:DNA-binding transcriptional MerR regulator
MAEAGTKHQEVPEIPDKLYFRIGEVSRLVGVEPYVLRYWETEFPALAPKKSGTGQRLYRRREVELALEIKRLLYQKRYTLEGARQQLKNAGKGQRRLPSPKEAQGKLFAAPAVELAQIRGELVAILELMK